MESPTINGDLSVCGDTPDLFQMTAGAGSDGARGIIPRAGTDTVADYVAAAAAPYLAAQLISPEALADIQHVAGRLPGAITDFFGFECELGSDRASADFLICCRTRQGARELLAGQTPGFDIPSAFEEHPIWRRIRAFSKQWAKPESLLYLAVHNLWFELDIDGTRPPIPVPNVFIGADRLRSSAPHADIGRMPKECAWLTDLALPLLLGQEVCAAARRQLARCINLLPPEGRLFQVGLMLARDTQAARVCVRGIATGQIVPYLRAIGWKGAWSELESLLQSLEQRVERIDLDLDVTDHVLPKIGLECYPGAEERRSQEFLAHLVSSRLCTAGKSASIATWSGTTYQAQTPDVWPQQLLAASGKWEARVHSAFVRRLHHIKLDFPEAAPLRAKAYLGIHHKWLATEIIPENVNRASNL